VNQPLLPPASQPSNVAAQRLSPRVLGTLSEWQRPAGRGRWRATHRSWRLAICALGASAACLLPLRAAQAAPPGSWSVGVERLFGLSRATTDTEIGDVTVSSTSTSISLFSALIGRNGYSSPRLAFDYLADSGVTFGGAFAYSSTSFEGNDDDDSAWLLAARVGYFARPSAGFGVWPRAGLTHLVFEDDEPDNNDLTATALTLEVPLVFLVGGSGIGLTFMPHADIGIAGGTDNIDQKITELGLQFGLNAFF
jgi:hypothetical protein